MHPGVATQEDQVEGLRFEQGHSSVVRFDGFNTITFGLQKGHPGPLERAIVSDDENALRQSTTRV